MAETSARRWAAAGLALFGVLLYAQTLRFPFLYDDDSFILLNPAIRSLKNAPAFFTEPGTLASDQQLAHDNYRPLVTLSFALNHAAGGLDPFGYRLLNLLLHLANGFLVYLLFIELGGGGTAALAAAGVFLAHPVQVESVVFTSSRSNLLSELFMLSAFLLHLRRGKAGPAPLALFGLGLLCKESVIVLPALIGAWDLLKGRGSKAAVLRVLPYAVLAAAYFALRTHMLGRMGQTAYWGGSLGPTLLTEVRGFATYLRLLVWPSTLSLEYLFSVSRSPFEPEVLLAAAVLAAVLGLTWRLRRIRPLFSYGLIFFFIGLGPVSNLIPIKAVIQERFLYVSMAGFALAAGDLVAWTGGSRWARLWPLVLLALSARTFVRSQDWRSHKALVLATLRTCPQSARMHYGIGRAWASEGQFDKAAQEFQLALAIDPAYDEASSDLGRLALQRGDIGAAIENYRKTLQVRVDAADALFNLGTSYLKGGDAASARPVLEAAAKAFDKKGDASQAAEARSNLAVAYASTGQVEKAVALLEAQLALRPGDEKAAHNLELFKAQLAGGPSPAGVVEELRKSFPSFGPGLERAAALDYLETARGIEPRSAALKPEEQAALAALAIREGKDPGARLGPALPKDYAKPHVIAFKDGSVEILPLGARAAAAAVEGGFVVYPEAYKHTTVLFSAGPDSMEQLYFLRDKQAPRSFRMRLRPEGSLRELRLNERGNLEAADASGRSAIELSRPRVLDAGGRSVQGRYRLEGGRGTWTLTVDFDAKGLRYPLLID